MITRGEFIGGSLAAIAATAAPAPSQSPLDRYLAIATPEYDFQIVSTTQMKRYRIHVVWMTSQRWRSASEVNRPLWQHWMTIIEPEHIRSRIGVLVISGGSNGDKPPGKIESVIGNIAVRTGALVAEIRMVPNQPLLFADEHHDRAEDDLVAYSWNKYLHTGDETWPLRLPMTKAAVRAMDTMTAFSRSAGHHPVVDRFIVGGSSKRGWTAWLTAAADSRVVALVPVVIDVLNVEASALHGYRVYGTWPEALESYQKMGIMNWFGTPQLDALMRIEDPYAYRERITVPKLIVNATGDQFFTPDNSQFYFDGLLGEKYLRYLPNTDHSLRGVAVDAAKTGVAFIDQILADAPGPRYSWSVDPDGGIRVKSATKPLLVRLWQAVNPHSRDFRFQTIGRAFNATYLQDQGDNTYVGNVERPPAGYAAYFVELVYETLRTDLFTVSTGVQIKPNVLPFAAPRRRR